MGNPCICNRFHVFYMWFSVTPFLLLSQSSSLSLCLTLSFLSLSLPLTLSLSLSVSLSLSLAPSAPKKVPEIAFSKSRIFEKTSGINNAMQTYSGKQQKINIPQRGGLYKAWKPPQPGPWGGKNKGRGERSSTTLNP